MALNRSVLDSNKESDIEVDGKTYQRFTLFAVFVGHRVDRKQDHAQSHLVAISFANRGTSVLVETHVWLSSA